ncbi:MAG: rRNA maturation RNase YbeY [Gemmatimonadales bacterium]|nr:rRNA maturation RNase YbeY [Gemmatimonadales bacterium]
MPTRKTRAAEPPAPVVVRGNHAPLARRRVEAAVRLVLQRERVQAAIAVTFLGPTRMRALNRRWKGHDRPTDVLAFALPQRDGSLVGDIFVCRAVAKAEAAARGLSLREELLRLVIHGTLHVAGHDHPDDERRVRSPMWRRQERYLACLV